jgi:hypothetical protein
MVAVNLKSASKQHKCHFSVNLARIALQKTVKSQRMAALNTICHNYYFSFDE